MQLCQRALLFTSWDSFWVATSTCTCSIQSSMFACVLRHAKHPEAASCLFCFSKRWMLLQEQTNSELAQVSSEGRNTSENELLSHFNDMRLPPIDGSSLPPLSTQCQAAQMVPIHLDIFLSSSIQAGSPKAILLDNGIEVSTSIQPDKYWATSDGVIQGRPLTHTRSAPGFQSLGKSLKRKNEGCFSTEQGNPFA